MTNPDNIDLIDDVDHLEEAAPASEDAAVVVVEPENVLPEWAVKNPDGSVSFPLKWPFERKLQVKGGPIKVEKIENLCMRRPNAGDFFEMETLKNEGAAAKLMISRLLQTDVHLVSRLDIEDLYRAIQVMEYFFPKGMKVGTGKAGGIISPTSP
ncbi:MAG: hypothetical protein GC185_01890 [Alphaproteobacteria bacterium]|nr:hypothetical protein [Alphaproteobacteria bacterium]